MSLPTSKIYNCDCMEFMKNISDKHFDLAIVDPPYGLKKSSVTGRGKLINIRLATANMSWDIAPTQEYFDQLFRISKNQIIWGGNYFTLPPTRGIICWDKEQAFENFSAFEYAWTSFYKPSKIIRINSQRNNPDKIKIHPTQKPVKLYAWLLKHYAKSGDKIFDSHLGSGSSRIAAYKMGFDFVGCEISKNYFDAEEKRFKLECLEQIDTPKGVLVQKNLFE